MSIDSGLATIVAAVIAALASIGLAMSERRRKQTVRELEAARNDLHTALVNNYGLEIKNAICRLEIRDLDGNQRVSLSWEKVKAGAGKEFEGLPGRFWTGSPAGKLGTPDLSYTFSRAIVLDIRRHESKLCEYMLKIPGRLSSGDGELSYSVNVDVEKGCLMAREDVEATYAQDALPFEYHVFEVAFPTVDLEVQVTFPAGYAAKPFAAALYGGTEFQHQSESQRIRKNLTIVDRVATLRVEYPLPGFRYAIYWESPKRAALAAQSAN